MNLTFVDSNVLLDIVTSDVTWFKWSSAALETAYNEGGLCINPIILAEVSVTFARIEDGDSALPLDKFRRLDLPIESAFLAGKAFVDYRNRGGARTSALPDFFIGAHAAVTNLRLLTRDVRRFHSYFPTVELICPPNQA